MCLCLYRRFYYRLSNEFYELKHRNLMVDNYIQCHWCHCNQQSQITLLH
uniref:Uncharacterized protein n=1 Tax=Picea glauca TaxID=3330 RepID=A0A101LTM6_PICGL|nr:hypothetical protein ABT39_MTgene3635 [Picea glauca]